MKALTVVVFLALLQREAWADCGIEPWTGTPANSRIPSRGALYVYQYAGDIPVEGNGITWTVSRLSDHISRIDYRGIPGGELTLWGRWMPTKFVIGSTPAASMHAPEVVQYWYESYAWTCAAEDSLNIQIDQPTAVIRAEWTFAGATKEWIVPPHNDSAGRHVVVLGEIACGETTVPPSELARGGRLRLFAIAFDGSETEVQGLPSIISTSGISSSPIDAALVNVWVRNQPDEIPETSGEHRTAPLVILLVLLTCARLSRAATTVP